MFPQYRKVIDHETAICLIRTGGLLLLLLGREGLISFTTLRKAKNIEFPIPFIKVLGNSIHFFILYLNHYNYL